MMTDMTQGTPSKILWNFSLPMLCSVMFQQLYNIVDSVVAGKFAGKDALAAIGASYPITMIFMAIATGSNIGCSVVISQLFGAKKIEKMKTAISTSILSIFILGSILTIIGFSICKPIMNLLKTPNNIFSDSTLYLNIYIAGLLFLFLYNICTGIFTALGDSKTPLYFLMASSIGNIILDLIFVIVFHWGVAGVAWATFLAQGVSSILSFFALVKRIRSIKTEIKPPVFSWNLFGRISLIAIPSILQQSFISIGNLFIQTLVNGYGSDTIAGYSAAIKLNTFAITSFTTLGNGISNFTAQNLGAGKIHRIRKGFRSGVIMILCIALPIVCMFYFLSPNLVKLFLGSEDAIEVVSVGSTFLKIVSPFYLVISIKLIADGVLRGSSAMVPFMISTFSDLILRVLLAFILSDFYESKGIWMSWPAGWTLAMFLSCGFYFLVQSKNEKQALL